MSDTYTVVMTGKIADEANIEEVKANVARLFKLSGAQLDKIFSGKPVAVRRGVELTQADKICAALLNAGAVAKVKADRAGEAPKAAAQQQPAAAKSGPVAVESPASTPEATQEPAPAAAKKEGFAPDLECPRCGHEQPFTKQCGLCKMDLTLHIQRLRRKEQRRAFRREQKAHATG